MIDKKYIGLKSAPHTVEVEKGQLRFFAKAAGYASLPAPQIFAFCLDMGKPNPFEDLETMCRSGDIVDKYTNYTKLTTCLAKPA